VLYSCVCVLLVPLARDAPAIVALPVGAFFAVGLFLVFGRSGQPNELEAELVMFVFPVFSLLCSVLWYLFELSRAGNF